MLFQESIQSYPQRRTRGIRCHFFLWAVIEPVVVNNDKWPEEDEIPKHITTSRLSRVLMYCSTCQPTHTSSFTLWQLSEGFLSFGSITHNCTHFRTRLWGWCSVRAPTAWASVPPPGTSACGAACGMWLHRAFWTLKEGKLWHRWNVCASPVFPEGCGQLQDMGMAQGSMLCPSHYTAVTP